jgi:hypothetical protein
MSEPERVHWRRRLRGVTGVHAAPSRVKAVE